MSYRDLLIDMDAPFRLHVGFDGWQAIEDRPSSPLPFGRHGVRLTTGELADRGVLDFTMYFMDETRWHGIDFRCGLLRIIFRKAACSRVPPDASEGRHHRRI
jgi:glucoamylase